jgi:hypothetical protein
MMPTGSVSSNGINNLISPSWHSLALTSK